MKLIAAVAQTATVLFDTAATVAKAETLMAEAAARGAQVLVFPEAFIGGYPKGADFHIFIGARTPEGRQDFLKYYEAAVETAPKLPSWPRPQARTSSTFASASSSAMAERCTALPCTWGLRAPCWATTASSCPPRWSAWSGAMATAPRSRPWTRLSASSAP